MAKPTNQWACIAILALMGSTLAMAHVVKPPSPKPARLRKLQMDKNSEEPETNKVIASNLAHNAGEHHQSQMDKTQASASGCGGNSGSASSEGRSIYGEGYGSGGTTFGFHNVFPSPSFPFGGLVPEVTTWGEGGGSGGSNPNAGRGVNCQCNNGFPFHYVITPIHFQPMNSFSFNRMRKDGPNDMAPIPSGN